MKSLLILSAAVLTFSNPFAFADVESLVQNGTPVGASSPLNQTVARLHMGSSSCSATFLSARTLLTAAHCLSGKLASGVQVQVRAKDGSWHSQRASRLVVHPQYKIQNGSSGARTRYDFGLVHLSSAMSTPTRAARVADAGGSSGWFRVTVAGYGWNSKGSGVGVLRTGAMHAQATSLSEFFGDRGLWMKPVSTQATCPGDSGGPVFREGSSDKVIGVHSLSSGCQGGKDGEAQSLSALPSQVASWIRANTN